MGSPSRPRPFPGHGKILEVELRELQDHLWKLDGEAIVVEQKRQSLELVRYSISKPVRVYVEQCKDQQASPAPPAGHLPDTISCLEEIEVLNLGHNKLSGILPDVVCSLRSLANLTVFYNLFSGFSQDCSNLFVRSVGFDFSGNCIPRRNIQSLLFVGHRQTLKEIWAFWVTKC
ncbi:hypothetical protein FH972_002232 [Carpinus fangiana]|uniref:Uncharacterized protein n=1 Tax=Carpinus fangiana TaxID=176857 RepID=A0A5N6QE97_9ROSI|nr:hypothetical protein FH972_002232 [Carpinus fangiana]